MKSLVVKRSVIINRHNTTRSFSQIVPSRARVVRMNKQQKGKSYETTAHLRCRAHARMRVRDSIECKA
jgi:hypothetical protein